MNRTAVLILVLIIAVAGLLALSLNSKPSSPPTIPSSVAQTTLRLTSPVASTSGVLTSNVLINTGGNKVTAVQLELSYNPNDLGSLDITPGAFIKTPTELLKTIDTNTGRISYALGIELSQKGVQGSGILATLSFTKLRASGLTTISFLPKSLVSAQGIAQSVLRTTTGVTFDLSK